MTHTKGNPPARNNDGWLKRTLRSVSEAVFGQITANSSTATEPPIENIQHLNNPEAVRHLYGSDHATMSDEAAKNVMNYANRTQAFNVIIHSKTHAGTILVNINKYYDIEFIESDNGSSLLCFRADRIPVKGSAAENQKELERALSKTQNSWIAVPLLDPNAKLENIYKQRRKQFLSQGLDEETGLPLPDFKGAKIKDTQQKNRINFTRAEIISFEMNSGTSIKIITTSGDYLVKYNTKLIQRLQNDGMKKPLDMYEFELANPLTPNLDEAKQRQLAINSRLQNWRTAEDYARGLKHPPSRDAFEGHPSMFNG